MDQSYAWNGSKMIAKTASYTVLVTDEEIQCSPAADMTLTLPAITSLAAAGFCPKCFMFSKKTTSNFTVRIAAATGEYINGQDALYLSSNGEEVIIQSSVVGNWTVVESSARRHFRSRLQEGKVENIDIVTTSITGQINGIEINFSGPNASCTGSNSYTAMRVKYYCRATSGTLMTAQAAFFAVMSSLSTEMPFGGNINVLCAEVYLGYVSNAPTTSILTLSTRGAVQTATYHNLSAYITIRDYTTSQAGTGALPNLFSLAGGDALTWTIPTNSATALFTTYTTDIVSTHAFHCSVAGVSYWIPAIATAPH